MVLPFPDVGTSSKYILSFPETAPASNRLNADTDTSGFMPKISFCASDNNPVPGIVPGTVAGTVPGTLAGTDGVFMGVAPAPFPVAATDVVGWVEFRVLSTSFTEGYT